MSVRSACLRGDTMQIDNSLTEGLSCIKSKLSSAVKDLLSNTRRLEDTLPRANAPKQQSCLGDHSPEQMSSIFTSIPAWGSSISPAPGGGGEKNSTLLFLYRFWYSNPPPPQQLKVPAGLRNVPREFKSVAIWILGCFMTLIWRRNLLSKMFQWFSDSCKSNIWQL